MAKPERKTVAWRQKFMELAGLTVGPEAMNMEPDDVIGMAKNQGAAIEGLLDRIQDRLEKVAAGVGAEV